MRHDEDIGVDAESGLVVVDVTSPVPAAALPAAPPADASACAPTAAGDANASPMMPTLMPLPDTNGGAGAGGGAGGSAVPVPAPLSGVMLTLSGAGSPSSAAAVVASQSASVLIDALKSVVKAPQHRFQACPVSDAQLVRLGTVLLRRGASSSCGVLMGVVHAR
jgi:hypothetical protein